MLLLLSSLFFFYNFTTCLQLRTIISMEIHSATILENLLRICLTLRLVLSTIIIVNQIAGNISRAIAEENPKRRTVGSSKTISQINFLK